MRGFTAIGLVRPKTPENVGGAMRAAYCYRASLIAIEGERGAATAKRYLGHATDVQNAWKHIPTLIGDLRTLIPHDCVPIAVDLVPDAVPLPAFQHPQRAFYIFGPEDGTLGKSVLDWCVHRVEVPTRSCMNLASCVNVVLYDRLAKAHRMERGIRYAEVA